MNINKRSIIDKRKDKTMIKIKGKLPNKSMQLTNQGYYTDSIILLLNDYVKAYDNTVNSAVQSNKDYGVSNKIEMQQLPDVKKLIESAMRYFVNLQTSEDGFYYLANTHLKQETKETLVTVFYNETTKDYTFIDSKYTDYLEQFNFRYVRLGDDNFSQVGIIDNHSVLVGIVMPIVNVQNEYLV